MAAPTRPRRCGPEIAARSITTGSTPQGCSACGVLPHPCRDPGTHEPANATACSELRAILAKLIPYG